MLWVFNSNLLCSNNMHIKKNIRIIWEKLCFSWFHDLYIVVQINIELKSAFLHDMHFFICLSFQSTLAAKEVKRLQVVIQALQDEVKFLTMKYLLYFFKWKRISCSHVSYCHGLLSLVSVSDLFTRRWTIGVQYFIQLLSKI